MPPKQTDLPRTAAAGCLSLHPLSRSISGFLLPLQRCLLPLELHGPASSSREACSSIANMGTVCCYLRRPFCASSYAIGYGLKECPCLVTTYLVSPVRTGLTLGLLWSAPERTSAAGERGAKGAIGSKRTSSPLSHNAKAIKPPTPYPAFVSQRNQNLEQHLCRARACELRAIHQDSS